MVAVGSVGAHMQRQGWDLGRLSSSHCRSRCVTTVVPVPDLSSSVPTDLHLWLCVQCLRENWSD